MGRDTIDHQVDLVNRTFDFQDLLYPCCHAVRLIADTGRNWKDYVGDLYKNQVYREGSDVKEATRGQCQFRLRWRQL